MAEAPLESHAHEIMFEYDNQSCVVRHGRLVKFPSKLPLVEASFDRLSYISNINDINKIQPPSSTFVPSSVDIGDEEMAREELDHVFATLAYEILKQRKKIAELSLEVRNLKQGSDERKLDRTMDLESLPENDDVSGLESEVNHISTSPLESPIDLPSSLLVQPTTTVVADVLDEVLISPSPSESLETITAPNLEVATSIDASPLPSVEPIQIASTSTISSSVLSAESVETIASPILEPSPSIDASPLPSVEPIEPASASTVSTPSISVADPPSSSLSPSSETKDHVMTGDEFAEWCESVELDPDDDYFLLAVCDQIGCEGRLDVLQYVIREFELDLREDMEALGAIVENACNCGFLHILRFLHRERFPFTKTMIYQRFGVPIDGGLSASDFAISGGQLEVVKWLREVAGLDVLRLNKQTRTSAPLRTAVQNGYLSLVKYLVAIGGNVKEVDPKTGANLAHAAAKGSRLLPRQEDNYGIPYEEKIQPTSGSNKQRKQPKAGPVRAVDNVEVLQWLQENGVDLKAKMKDGTMTTHLAARAGDLKLLLWLQSKGLDLRKRTANERSIAYFAAELQHLNVLEWLDASLKWNFVEDRSSDASTLAHAAAGGIASASRMLEVLQFLHAHGVSMKAKRKAASGTSVVSLISFEYQSVLPWLHSIGVDVKSECAATLPHVEGPMEQGDEELRCTVLHKAVFYGHLDFLQWLHSIGADFSITSHAYTLPAVAAYSGQLDVLKWLHGIGLDVLELCTATNVPLSKDPNMCYLAVPNLEKLPAPFLATARGHLEVVKWYLEKMEMKPNALDTRGSTSFLAIAIAFGHVKILDLLVEYGVDPIHFAVLQIDVPPARRKFGQASSAMLAIAHSQLDVLTWLNELHDDYAQDETPRKTMIGFASFLKNGEVLNWFAKNKEFGISEQQQSAAKEKTVEATAPPAAAAASSAPAPQTLSEKQRNKNKRSKKKR